MMNPEISIIVPVWNAERFLAKCLDSILGQTFKDIEVIAVNDGAADRSPAILNDFAKKDSRLHIVNKKNGGISSARNAGIDVARGQYIAFSDDDDWMEPHMYEKMYNAMISHDVDAVKCGFKWETKHVRNEMLVKNSNVVPHDAVWENMSRTNMVMIWTGLYKKSIISMHNIRFNQRLSIGEDLDFTMEYFAHAKSAYFLSDCLYHFRMDEGSTSHRYQSYRYAVTLELERSILERFGNHPELKKYYPETMRTIVNDYACSVDNVFLRGNSAPFKSKVCQLTTMLKDGRLIAAFKRANEYDMLNFDRKCILFFARFMPSALALYTYLCMSFHDSNVRKEIVFCLKKHLEKESDVYE